jgi:hypothetical protein
MTKGEAKTFLCSIAGDLGFTDIENYTCKDGEKTREAIKALEQDPVFFSPCQDCNTKMDEIRRAYDKLQEQEPCDAVSRKEVMNMLHNHAFDYATSTKISALLKTMRVEVDRMPPVTPAEKVGHWEWVQYDGNPNIGNWHCSECNRIVCGAITAVNPVYSYKYCPQCGCKMQEVEE